jgi:hypothetical protein
VEVGTEGFPDVPGSVDGNLSAAGDASGCNFLDNAQFRANTVSFLGCTSFQQG